MYQNFIVNGQKHSKGLFLVQQHLEGGRIRKRSFGRWHWERFIWDCLDATSIHRMLMVQWLYSYFSSKVPAQSAGDYSWHCFWRMVGNISVVAAGFRGHRTISTTSCCYSELCGSRGCEDYWFPQHDQEAPLLRFGKTMPSREVIIKQVVGTM